MATSWEGVASATDLTACILEVLDTVGRLNLPVRVRLTEGQRVHMEPLMGLHSPDSEYLLEITGLTLVQADPELGSYIELEVAYD